MSDAAIIVMIICITIIGLSYIGGMNNKGK